MTNNKMMELIILFIPELKRSAGLTLDGLFHKLLGARETLILLLKWNEHYEKTFLFIIENEPTLKEAYHKSLESNLISPIFETEYLTISVEEYIKALSEI